MTSDDSLSLPEANEFSPGQIDLGVVLQLVDVNKGDRAAMVEAIRQRFFSKSAAKHADSSKRLKQQQTRSNNVLIGMKGYRLFDRNGDELTEDGKRLLAIEDEEMRYAEFALHVLRHCHGIDVLEAVRNIQTRGEAVGKASLDRELRSRGFRLPRATTHHTKLLQWLRTAKLVDKRNSIDEEAFARLTGFGLAQLEEWAALTTDQKAFLRALRNLVEVHGTELISAKEVVDHATIQHGSVFKYDQLRAQVFRPLAEGGWLELAAVGPGRGGKSGQLRATGKLLELDLGIVTETTSAIPPDLRAKRNIPLDVIYKDLESKNPHKKGIALELLSIRMAAALGLIPIGFRFRARDAGGEVDLLAEGAHLHFSRWLFQCKNVKTPVPLSALAKEIGMAVLLRAHVVVMVTTGDFSESVVRQARELGATTPLQAVLVDGTVLSAFQTGGPQSLLAFFHEQATTTMRTKRGQIEGVGAES